MCAGNPLAWNSSIRAKVLNIKLAVFKLNIMPNIDLYQTSSRKSIIAWTITWNIHFHGNFALLLKRRIERWLKVEYSLAFACDFDCAEWIPFELANWESDWHSWCSLDFLCDFVSIIHFLLWPCHSRWNLFVMFASVSLGEPNWIEALSIEQWATNDRQMNEFRFRANSTKLIKKQLNSLKCQWNGGKKYASLSIERRKSNNLL